MANAFKDVINRLQRQRAAIERALAALQEVDDTEASTPTAAVTKTRRKKKRFVTEEVRAKMVEGQQRRWAAKKAAEKKAARKAARKRAVKKATAKEA